jgi:hypothetical protein
MKRVLVLVAAIGLILPAAAQAGTFNGVVIAKSAKRHAVVIASKNGTVRTVRAPKSFRKLGLGAVVKIRAGALPDGTFAATATRQVRTASKARVRAVVVKRAAKRLYVSAGHSVFALSLRKGAGGKLRPGDRIATTATVGKAKLFCEEIEAVGHTDELELEGIYLSTDGGVLSIAVLHRGLVKVAVPDGLDVPEFAPGDQVWLLVTVEPDGSFTLVSADNEEADDGEYYDDGDGVDMDDNYFSVTGVLSALSATSVAVEVERHPEPVHCSVPAKVSLDGFAVGQLVEMKCRLVDGRFVLYALRSKTAELPGDGDGKFAAKGFIASLDGGKIEVKLAGGQTVACALKPGQDLRGFAVGDFVEMKCRYNALVGKYQLAWLYSDHASIYEDEHEGKEGWFHLSGVITTLAPSYIAVQVAHHPQPVQCSLPAGMDLRGFAVGEGVELKCTDDGAGYYVKGLYSDSAAWPHGDDMPWLDLEGTLKSMRSDGVGVQVPGHTSYVDCAMPAGTDLSGFAIGDIVEMRCNYHDGAWRLAKLRSEHATLTLEG